jgi:hypothetical protein
MIAASTLLAVLPLVPILYKYLVVHRRHGFVRGVEEIKLFSADVGAVLCAPELMSFWGRLRISCRAEGELFPGVAVMVLFAIGIALVFGWRSREPAPPLARHTVIVQRVFTAIALFYLAIGVSLLVGGPWRIELAGIHASATSLRRPLMLGLPSLAIVAGSSMSVRRAIGRQWTLAFYLLSAIVMWLFALGPSISYMGHDTGAVGPFFALMQVPGADGLRVPARFWMIVVLSLSTVAGLVIASLSAGRRATATAALVVIVGGGILADGWVPVIPMVAAPDLGVPAITLTGRTVMSLPIGDTLDIPGTYFAATGGWRTVNGYSGYGPSYYPALNYAVRFEEGTAFEVFRTLGDLDVLVSSKAGRLRAMVEGQPGVRVVTQNEQVMHYVLPRRGRADVGDTAGQRLRVSAVTSDCGAPLLPLASDGHEQTRWVCGPENVARALLIDLGQVVAVGAVVNGLGQFNGDFPPELTVETSSDGTSWQPAWQGSLLAQAIRAGIRSPASLRIVVPFAPRAARYVRLTHPAAKDYYWSIAELEVWSGTT